MKFFSALAVVLALSLSIPVHAQVGKRPGKPSGKPAVERAAKLADLVGGWIGGPTADVDGTEPANLTDTIVVRPDGTVSWNWDGWEKGTRPGRVARDTLVFTSGGPNYRTAIKSEHLVLKVDSTALDAQIKVLQDRSQKSRAFTLLQISGESSLIPSNKPRIVYVFSKYETDEEVLARMTVPGPDGSISQLASSVTASSEYSSTDWSARRALGVPKMPAVCGDQSNAWASQKKDGEDWLEVTFTTPVVPAQIDIHEVNAPGSIGKVEVKLASGQYATVYSATPGVKQTCPRILSINVSEITEKINVVKISLDQKILKGWDEIDAVKLVGKP